MPRRRVVMKKVSYLQAGHLIFMSAAVQLYILIRLFEEPKGLDFILLLIVAVCIVAYCRTFLFPFELLLSALTKKSPRMAARITCSWRSAFLSGGLIGLLDLGVMAIVAIPFYFLLDHFWASHTILITHDSIVFTGPSKLFDVAFTLVLFVIFLLVSLALTISIMFCAGRIFFVRKAHSDSGPRSANGC